MKETIETHIDELTSRLFMLEEMRQENEKTIKDRKKEYRKLREDKEGLLLLVRYGRLELNENVKNSIEKADKYMEELLAGIEEHKELDVKLEKEIHKINNIILNEEISTL